MVNREVQVRIATEAPIFVALEHLAPKGSANAMTLSAGGRPVLLSARIKLHRRFDKIPGSPDLVRQTLHQAAAQAVSLMPNQSDILGQSAHTRAYPFPSGRLFGHELDCDGIRDTGHTATGTL